MYYIDKTFTLLINKIINRLLVRFEGVGTHFISLFKDEKTLTHQSSIVFVASVMPTVRQNIYRRCQHILC